MNRRARRTVAGGIDLDFETAVGHHRAGRLEKAQKIYRRIVKARPDHVDALHNLGVLAAQVGQHPQALAYADRILAHHPEHVQALGIKATALRHAGQFEKALACFDGGLAVKPDDPTLINNKGNLLRDLWRFDEALDCYEIALRSDPNRLEVLNNKGWILAKQGRIVDALACFDRIIALKPDHADAHFGRGMAYLHLNRYGEAWPEYQWRWRTKAPPRPFRPQAGSAWRGEDISDKTLYIYLEQGFGDTLQFIRYVPLAVARAGQVVLEVSPALARLFAEDGNAASAAPFGVAATIGQDEQPAQFDVHASLVDLAEIFETTVETIPAAIPYLSVSLRLAEAWAKRLTGDTFRVGIAWAGNPNHSNDRNRSMDPTNLAPLADLPGVRLYSLQVGEDRGGGVAAFGGNIENLAPLLDDFAETAAAMSNLDLIISVDTAAAHLAGALGLPIWVMLPHFPEWRYLTDKNSTRWYPNMRLFKQDKPGNWPSVVSAVGKALVDEIAARRPGG